jgi:2-polyprenyl-6-methoxyphenol hydroxylase and related FAD-dependent oxidoreductases
MNGASPFALNFTSGGAAGQDLGWLVPNHLIRRAAWEAVQGQAGLEVLDGRSVTHIETGSERNVLTLKCGQQVSARLVAAADGRFSATRRMMGIGAQMRDSASRCWCAGCAMSSRTSMRPGNGSATAARWRCCRCTTTAPRR